MDKKLFGSAMLKFISGLLLMGLLLFLPAGSFAYWQAWLLIGILFVPMFLAGLVMMARSPELLRKRLSAKEEQAEQKQVIAFSGLMFLAAFVLAGLNFRFGWLRQPRWLVWAATALFLLGYLLYAEVLRENAYLSRTIEVQENQKVIDTGLYGIVRHPMYAATLLLFLAMPLVLASPPLLCRHAVVSAYHRQAHPQRGGGTGAGPGRLCRLQTAGEVQSHPGNLVKEEQKHGF